MNRPVRTANPFYVALLVVGILFVITACAYAVMTVQSADMSTAPHGLVQFMQRHGFTLLMSELGMLAVATLGAIGTDDYWARRSSGSANAASEADGEPTPADKESRP